MGQNGIIIKGFPVQQNGQDFIIGKASIKDILTYTRYTERLIIGFDEDEKPIYNPHIQRKVETSRVNKIADFLINDPEAMFPTNIVLGIPMSMISSQFSHDGIIEISLDEKVTSQIKLAKEGYQDADIFITIIDGQHRIRGVVYRGDYLPALDGRGQGRQRLRRKVQVQGGDRRRRHPYPDGAENPDRAPDGRLRVPFYIVRKPRADARGFCL